MDACIYTIIFNNNALLFLLANVSMIFSDKPCIFVKLKRKAAHLSTKNKCKAL